MEQVHSKENFNAVTVMASILSAAMVIFSIVCIIMFMVNMLQSYFQKVKRNIGTFKAFGMNGNELIQVYIIILVAIVCSGVILALLITWSIQGLLPVIGIEKEGFNYLSLWNSTTYIATVVILASTVFTVVFVMTRLLNQTPGDLIYDRN
jgi:predicted lysophospholipase L1 biosynthesis ABC-type transport system permease subunit